MKYWKKFASIALALVMVLALAVPAFADETETNNTSANETQETVDNDNSEPGEFGGGNTLKDPEDTITARGLDAGDSVEYFQLVEWKDREWKLTTLGEACGVTLAELINGITEAEATMIANSLAGKTATGTMKASDNGVATATVEPGLYYLKAVAEDKDTVYNPAFVSADYFDGNNEVSFSDTIGSSAVVKKSTVTFEKEAGDEKYDFITVKPGDDIPYTITAQIPSYGTTFTNPQFTITDTLSDGLTLNEDPGITVTVGGITVDASATTFTLTEGTPENGFTVDFVSSYLQSLGEEVSAREVKITYTAKVGDDVPYNVNPMDNTAELEFSNTPGTTEDKESITRHYTFSIDGSLLGSTGEGYETSEVIKIGVNSDGSPITSTTTETFYGDREVNPLAGATFKLTGKKGTDTEGIEQEYTTTNDGRINFTGLRAGEYTLEEISAPTGYVRDTTVYTVKIEPTFDTAITDLLTSYTITFKDADGNGNSTTFETENDGGTKITSSQVGDGSKTEFFENVPGTELPSTGGIGTTIFYIVGGVLVLGAVVLLITKRRTSVDDE